MVPVSMPVGRSVPLLGLCGCLQSLSRPAAPPPSAPLAAPSRAAELLSAAAAHRAFVEHCLDHEDQQQTHQLAEMVEGWMTGEDAVEVALWHIQSGTCSPAHGKRPRTGTAPARRPGQTVLPAQGVRDELESSLARHAMLLASAEGGCSGRWLDQVWGPVEVKKSGWTPEEDQLVKDLVTELGTKWSEIVKHLPGRTYYSIKDRFHSNERRQLRIQRRAVATEEQPAASPKELSKRKRSPGAARSGG